MLYYKVKSKFDNYRLYKDKKQKRLYFGVLVANELYTKKELEKLEHLQNVVIPLVAFEKVNINKNKTYFCFGARFSE